MNVLSSCMLKGVDSFTLEFCDQHYTFSVTDRTLVVEENNSLCWRGPCNIASVSPVYNTSYVYVKLENSTGFVLSSGKSGLRELTGVSFCPAAVYGTSDFLIYNNVKSCYLHHIKTGKQTVRLNHQLIGYDFRTSVYIFKTADENVVFLDSTKFSQYQNLCLDSVASLPIAWVSVLSARALVLGTSLRRTMYVYDGVITSNFRLPHDVEYIRQLSSISIRVSGNSVSTELNIPVLGLMKTADGVEDEDDVSDAMKQLVISCDNHIKKELRGMIKLHCQYEKKVEFLFDIWNRLFEFTGDRESNQSDMVEYKSKRRKEDGACSSSANVTKHVFYQIPQLPRMITKTSVFLDSDGRMSVHCTDPSKPVLIEPAFTEKSSPAYRTLPISSSVELEETNQILVTPDFKEKLRRMFAEAMVSGEDSLTVDALAHMTHIVLAIDNR